MLNILFIFLGIGLLYIGGELLVSFASSLALRFNLSPLVIGLTVVAFGTSAPELAATLSAALSGSPAIAAANVIGSNIANLGLILGLCVLILPIAVSTKSILRRETPIMLLASFIALAFFANSSLNRLEGGILLSLLIGYIIWMLKSPKEAQAQSEETIKPSPLWLSIIGIIAGLILLVLGAQALVEGASTVARAFGIPERVIGLTLIAVGTSLPELASSLIAVFKRQTDMVLGNLIGSNIFNLLGILGISSLVTPLELPFAAIRLDLLVMIAFALLSFIFLATRKKIVRWEGLSLLLAYSIYVVYLF